MKPSLKKCTSVLALTLTLSAGMISMPRPANAAIGLMSVGGAGGVALAVLGGLSAGFGGSVALGSGGLTVLGIFVFVMTPLVGGIALLDGSNGQDIQFQRIDSPDMISRIGLSEDEVKAYNHELDTINLVKDEVAAQLSATGKTNDVKKAKALWDSKRADLSPDAYSALQKVAANALAR